MLIMCDVLNPDGTPHDTNTRAKLAELLTPDVVAEKPLYGFEQVQTLTRPCFMCVSTILEGQQSILHACLSAVQGMEAHVGLHLLLIPKRCEKERTMMM